MILHGLNVTKQKKIDFHTREEFFRDITKQWNIENKISTTIARSKIILKTINKENNSRQWCCNVAKM